jgi:hypothetical protein
MAEQNGQPEGVGEGRGGSYSESQKVQRPGVIFGDPLLEPQSFARNRLNLMLTAFTLATMDITIDFEQANDGTMRPK